MIIFIVIALTISIFYDINVNLKANLYHSIKEILGKWNPKINQYILEVKVGIVAHREAYCNLVVTLNTILASAVIFFYSVQDSKKEGIPHRTIISYSIGSLSIPILYSITMVLVPLSYFSYALKLPWTIYTCLILTYLIQMLIVYLILLSTSAQYSIHAIINLEIRQYRILTKLESEGWEIIGQKDSSYAWTYLLHHLIEVMKSDELSSDKLSLFRRYVWVPYCGKETYIWNYVVGKHKNNEIEKLLQENSLGQTFEFYRVNLLAVFNYLEQKNEEENKEKIFLILYEFIQKLTLEIVKYDEEQNVKRKKAYLMTIVSIMIALLESDLKEAEKVCSRILNDTLQGENEITKNTVYKIRCELLSLYVLAQEYMYCVNKDKVRLDNIDKIIGFEPWEESIKRNCELYKESWDIWMSHTTIAKAQYDYYFYKVLQSVHENRGDTVITAYIKFRREDQKWG